MTGISFILRGLVIGIIVSVPVGPIMMMTIQKSVSGGHKAGFSCGLGATLVDTVCGIISAFALSSIGSFIDAHTAIIEIVGGFFIGFVGTKMILTKPEEERRTLPYSSRDFVKAATMGFSNPAALAVMLAMFAGFKMDMGGLPKAVPVLTILALAAGSAGFWCLISWIAAKLGNRFNFKALAIVTRLAGAGILIFGIILIVRGYGQIFR